MNIAAKLHKIVSLDNHLFLPEMYRRVLNREPDEEGLSQHSRQLAKGRPKHRIMIDFLQSDEALEWFSAPTSLERTEQEAPVYAMIQRVFARKPEPFVHSLYRELLCREPDQPAYSGYVERLHRGSSKASVFKQFVTSGEFESLLGLEPYPFAKRVLDQLILSFYQ